MKISITVESDNWKIDDTYITFKWQNKTEVHILYVGLHQITMQITKIIFNSKHWGLIKTGSCHRLRKSTVFTVYINIRKEKKYFILMVRFALITQYEWLCSI